MRMGGAFGGMLGVRLRGRGGDAKAGQSQGE